jgi:hypothetical protein
MAGRYSKKRKARERVECFKEEGGRNITSIKIQIKEEREYRYCDTTEVCQPSESQAF